MSSLRPPQLPASIRLYVPARVTASGPHVMATTLHDSFRVVAFRRAEDAQRALRELSDPSLRVLETHSCELAAEMLDFYVDLCEYREGGRVVERTYSVASDSVSGRAVLERSYHRNQ